MIALLAACGVPDAEALRGPGDDGILDVYVPLTHLVTQPPRSEWSRLHLLRSDLTPDDLGSWLAVGFEPIEGRATGWFGVDAALAGGPVLSFTRPGLHLRHVALPDGRTIDVVARWWREHLILVRDPAAGTSTRIFVDRWDLGASVTEADVSREALTR